MTLTSVLLRIRGCYADIPFIGRNVSFVDQPVGAVGAIYDGRVWTRTYATRIIVDVSLKLRNYAIL